MVGTPLLLAVAVSPRPDVGPVPTPIQITAPAVVAAPLGVNIACTDELPGARRPATSPAGGPLVGSRGLALDPSWTGYAEASVRAVLGDAAPITTQSVAHGGRTVVLASGTDPQGRRVSAFTVHAADTQRQVAHRVCGHVITAVLPHGASTVEVQLDDGSAVVATADRLLAASDD